MASVSRDQALSLLAAANNHGDLAVKLSSLRQVKDILLTVDASFASELFPYLLELQFSPQGLVRKSLLEIVEEVGLRALEHSPILMPILLACLRDTDQIVVAQSIVSGMKFFCSVLEEMAMQMRRRGKIERWLEDLWMWMVKFKDVVFAIAFEPGVVSTRLLALKFLETFVLLFSPNNDDYIKPKTEGSRQVFNVTWLVGGYPFLEPVIYVAEAKRILGTLFELLRAANNHPGSVVITVITCLAAIAKKRTQHFNVILSTLLDFNVMNYERVKSFHAFSVQYSLRSAFLGFLRCTYPPIMESRERLVRVLRAMNAGDAVDQVLRQVDKLIRNAERASRDSRLMKSDQPPNDMHFAGDVNRKRSISQADEDSFHHQNVPSKRSNYGSDPNSVLQVQSTDSGNGSTFVEDASPNGPGLVGELTPAEQMIAMIGALLAEGERGAESLEILVSKMHPDMLADIVITNMKHLPKIPPPLTKLGSSQMAPQITSPSQGATMTGPTNSVPPVSIPQPPQPSVSVMNSLMPDSSSGSSFLTESKRDPRRDPRRQDPRLAVPLEVPPPPPPPPVQETASLRSDLEGPILSKPLSPVAPIAGRSFSPPSIMINKNDEEMVEHTLKDEPIHEVEALEDFKDIAPPADVNVFPEFAISPKQIDEGSSIVVKEEVIESDESEPEEEMTQETDHQSPTAADSNVLEDSGRELPSVPSYVELTAEQESSVRKLSFTRIIESYKNLTAKEYSEMGMALIARLAAQVDADHDLVGVLQKYILEDYQSQKGHELVLHILYHLHFHAADDSVGSSGVGACTYERFLISVAKSLLDHFPASDKSFSRLLGEAPILPNSLLKLMGDLCCSDVIDQWGKPLRDPDRVTQGLGSVWSLILGRPHYRQSCLDIALKCAVHPQDDIRAKSIRLVANKLYQLSYISENIEQFATNMLLSTTNPNASEVELSEHDLQKQPGAEDTDDKNSTSGLQVPRPVSSDSESAKDSPLSVPEAQRLTSLFFALCTKKPKLLHLVFDVYGQAPNTVKQAIHRQMPILLRALGSSFSELLHIISDPPKGSENLLTLVLHILTEETTPSPDLIATVKHLYETKLKDVSILIPVLSLFTKNEVLPIFPRLLDLPPEKFQKGLAYILQGSAHTGPALTPAEVLVAIHDIVPDKDGLPLKKVMDACSACFEQRTVFTQQVLAKALKQMVDQTPVPLLFMRTVIQAIDAFPALVDFVMEILSRLVSRQVWKMPKLWVGFLKCISQTQPHSYHVLLQLPQQQLEVSLNKYPNLRAPLSAFASQPSVRPTLHRSILPVLGLPDEPSPQQPQPSSSSVHSVT